MLFNTLKVIHIFSMIAWMAGLLYLIYANDIREEKIEKKSILYVDDTTDIQKGKDIAELQKKVQEEVIKTESWTADNRMMMAEKKTKKTVMSTRALRKNHSDQLSITIKQKTVEESKSERILGVIFSNDLTWHHHLYGEPEKPK